MKATGIVAEYNPFHKGHALHLNKTKEALAEPIIACMSGSFVQRGEPAFLDKWTRAKLAVEEGINLVLELPTCFTLRSAEFFAHGSVELLAATGLVTNISCGAEHPEFNYSSLAEKYFLTETQAALKNYLQAGFSYAAAMEKALGQALASPNDILAFEYAKACKKLNLKLHTFKREGSAYKEEKLTDLASASAIRKAYYEGNTLGLSESLPKAVSEVLKQKPAGYDQAKLWQLIEYALVTKTAEEIANSSECSEGLENLLKDAQEATSLAEALKLCTKKRYPTSRIQRLFTQLIFNKDRSYFSIEHPAYIRVLAFDDTGRELLKAMKEKASLPIITKLGQHPFDEQSEAFKKSLELDILASNLRELVSNAELQLNKDFLMSPYYKKIKAEQ